MPPYEHTGPVDCDVDFDTANLKGKTAIVTGGANGIGEAYVRALISVGAYVCIGDLDVNNGTKLADEFQEQARFVRCNTTNWEDQVHLFETAASLSPTGKVHYVVANAGIIRADDVFAYSGMVKTPLASLEYKLTLLISGDGSSPQKPDLTTIDVNIRGTLYTTKLATHYFIKQNGQTPSDNQEDTCLILIGSGAAFLDCLRIPQYSASKWAMRGIMHALRRTAFYYGSRVNVISPWYVKTNILSEEDFENVRKLGVEFALAEDAGQCLLRILSDTSVNGHSFFISARRWAKRGYIDFDIDDYPGNELIKEIQEDQMKGAPVEKGLLA